MANKRSTMHIVDILETVNKRNRQSTCPRDMRIGWNALLEELLDATGMYAGFGYLSVAEVPVGQKPGIIRNVENPQENTFPDDSRRVYYMHRRLKA